MSTPRAATVTAGEFSREFEEIFEQHYAMVYRTAYCVTGCVADAEDVVQTIFLRLLERRVSADFVGNPKGYLYRAAANRSLDVVRARKRRARIETVEHLADSVPVASTSESEELHRKLYEAIADLQPKAAEILLLHYLHGCSDAEIAKLLGTSRGTIAVNLYRSRSRLKKLLISSLGEER
jgi:RNA polymerase sigma-70 factor (ECF subfamily)